MWRDLNTPDNFRNDWYGELTNQISHTFLGAMAFITFCDVWFLVSGGMPFRSYAFIACFLAYAVGIEVIVQRWMPGDSWFDSLMFAFGAAGAALPVQEVSAAEWSVGLEYTPAYRLSIMAIWFAFLLVRVRRRLWR